MLLIRNVFVYAPAYLGKQEVLVSGGKIVHIADRIDPGSVPCRVLDGEGGLLVPGLLDQHVHVTGGGGEGGYHTRAPEVQLSELIAGGVTTVVGLLGTDGATRSVENLYAKTMALCEEGVSAYMLTGAYRFDSPTITGDPGNDILFCEKVLGAKLALSDHRSSNIGAKELIELASKTRVSGMLSGKPGMVVLHMGDGQCGLGPVFGALENSEVPVGIFRPTHVGRKKALQEEAFRLLEMGGYIDFTCDSRNPGSPGAAILEAMNRGLPLQRITVSSDGHGSWSTYDEHGNLLKMGVSGMDGMIAELRDMVHHKGIALEQALPFFTQNVAFALGLGGRKGTIAEQADADLLLLDDKLNIRSVVARGEILMEQGKLLRRGTYE